MLTATQIKNLKFTGKPSKHFDEKGLFLLINSPNSRVWRLKYRFDGKEKQLSLGTYPEISLQMARDRRFDARRLVATGIDPSAERKAKKEVKSGQVANSFEVIARERHAKFSANWKSSHSDKIIRRLERDIFPWLGAKPIAEITAPELLTVLRRIEGRGSLETAHRAQQNCSQVFRYAIATGRAERDPARDLTGALPPTKEAHLASIIEPRALGELLRAINAYNGSSVVRSALQLAPLLFVRPGELRAAEWSEFNLELAEWRIPAEKMKMRVQHIVPLSRQAVMIFRDLAPMTGNGRFVFPSPRSNKRCLSDNALLAALRRMGFEQGSVTVHGFRSTASTFLNEHGWNRDAIERQLAHDERNGVRAAYNFAEYLPERKQMMQWWADRLDAVADTRT
jgi:integrase